MNRRVLLTRIVQGFTITGLGFLAYPFIRAFVPTFTEDVSFDIDVSDLSLGESKTVSWLRRNLYVAGATWTEVFEGYYQHEEQSPIP